MHAFQTDAGSGKSNFWDKNTISSCTMPTFSSSFEKINLVPPGLRKILYMKESPGPGTKPAVVTFVMSSDLGNIKVVVL